jgi:hypothetical protein
MSPRSTFAFVLMVLVSGGCGPTPVSPGGNYAPVTAQQLAGKQMTHRTGGHPGSFTWVFDEDNFVIEGEGIPIDLSEAILGSGIASNRIKGTWSLQSDQKIRFETASDQPAGTHRAAELPIFFTGVIRIQTDDAQYCFPAN